MDKTLHTSGLSLFDATGAELSRTVTEVLLGATEKEGNQFQRSVSVTAVVAKSVAEGQILVLSNRESGEVSCAFVANGSQPGQRDGEKTIDGVITVGRIAPTLDKTQLMDPKLFENE